MTVTYVGQIPGTGSGGSGGWTDAIAFAAKLSFAETATLSDALSGALKMTQAETMATPTDAIKSGFGGLADVMAAPTDTRSFTTNTWATTVVSSANATNPSNALGSKDGSLAVLKAAGTPTATPGTEVIDIPVASVPAGGAKTLKVYYKAVAGTAGDTFSVTYTNTSGTPGSGTLYSGSATSTDYTSNPQTVAITAMGTQFRISFSATNASALTAGSISIEAASIESASF